MSIEMLKCQNINTALNLIYSSFHGEEFEEVRREAPVRLLDIDQIPFPGDIRDLPDTEEEETEENDEYNF